MRSAFMVCGICLFIVSMWTEDAAAQIEWQYQAIAENFTQASSVYAADMDGDGDLDVLGAASTADEISWWENLDGDALSWSEHPVATGFDYAYCVYAADVDGDGDVDVLGAAGLSDDITWWENNDGVGLSWFTHTVDGSFDNATTVYAADVDGDGDTDVLGSAAVDDAITWWENFDGSGDAWSTHVVSGVFDNAHCVYAADMDGDGDTDVLGAARGLDDITWWENLEGTGLNWSEHTVDGNFDGALRVFAADIDNDGDMDVLGAGYYADDVTWWENLDSGLNWLEHTVDGEFDAPTGVHAADVDSDGDLDLLGAASYADDISWWENLDGDGDNWSMHTVAGEFAGAYSVYSVDVDSDGDSDILGAAGGANCLSVWLQVGSPDFIEVTLSPSAVPLIVPRGGNFEYGAELVSNLPNIQYVDVWTEAVLPNNSIYGPIWLINDFPMGPNTIINAEAIVQEIPFIAPPGLYTYRMKAGIHPGFVAGEDDFPFEITAGASGMSTTESGWKAFGYSKAFSNQDQMGNTNSIDQREGDRFFAHPNPFNSATTITVTLPERTELKVQVYNLAGQHVAELADGAFSAGEHTLTFDASDLASGLYFIRTSIPGQLDQVRKVMLVR